MSTNPHLDFEVHKYKAIRDALLADGRGKMAFDYEVQKRTKGAWQRYIRGTETAARAAWAQCLRITHPALRLVELNGEKIKVIATAKATTRRGRTNDL